VVVVIMVVLVLLVLGGMGDGYLSGLEGGREEV